MNTVPSAPTPVWKPTLAALAAALLVLFGLYHETALAMMRIWARSDTFAHAFLVPPITLWLIWEKRQTLARQQPKPSPWLALPLAGLGFGWLLGDMAAVNAVTQFAFTGMLILAVPMIIGLPVARLITFPLGFLLFAVPIGEFVMPTLMDWTAEITVIALRASGIPVFHEGLHFVIPSGRWSVVEACSGVRYLIASLTVGTLFAYLNYRSVKRRLIFVGVSILVPIAANWIRAYMIVMLGHLSSGRIAAGVDHLIYGWVFFGVVIMIMFAVGMKWREVDPDPERDTDVEAAPGRSTSGVSVGDAGVRSLAIASLAFVVVAAVPHVALRALASGVAVSPPRLSPQTLVHGGWQLSNEQSVAWKPAFNNPSAELNVTVTNQGRWVGVYIGYYRQQDFERKLISSDNVLVTSQDHRWAQTERGTRALLLDGQPVTVRSARLRETAAAGPRILTAWHWYWINGHVTASDYAGKAWLAFSKLTGRGDDSAVVVLYAPEDQPGGAQAALEAFVADGGRGIDALLADAKAQR